jgi:nucleoside-diphosphate-sugar epimerase
MNRNIFITGGAGYVGTRLSEYLANKGYQITIYDTLYFGQADLSKNKNIRVIKGDIRNVEFLSSYLHDQDIFLHLACISNDATFALNNSLSTTINLDAFEPLVLEAKKKKIKRFIYASTSSVYGLSDKKDVKEDHPLVPITLYNKYKGMCEPLLFKHTDKDFLGVVFRPATVCGYSKRLRLDLSVNILTNHAFNNGIIRVFGGDQMRPNLNILDYIRAVELFINCDKTKIQNEIFNVGYQNLKIKEIAGLVQKVVLEKFGKKTKIIFEESEDKRSYHINSDKIYDKLGFKPVHSIEGAIQELCKAFDDNLVPNSNDDSNYYNVKKLLQLKIS